MLLFKEKSRGGGVSTHHITSRALPACEHGRCHGVGQPPHHPVCGENTPWVQTEQPRQLRRTCHPPRGENAEEMCVKEGKVTSPGLHPGFRAGKLSLRAVKGTLKILELPFTLPHLRCEGRVSTVLVGKVCDGARGCFSLYELSRVQLHQQAADDAISDVLPPLLK